MKYYKTSWLALGLLIVVASILRSAGWFSYEIYYVQKHLGGDKMTHFLAGLVFMYAMFLSFGFRRLKTIILCYLSVVMFVCIDEFSQRYLSSRKFSYDDLYATIAGSSLVMVFAVWHRVIRPN